MLTEIFAGHRCDIAGCVVRHLKALLAQLMLDCVARTQLCEAVCCCCNVNGRDLRYTSLSLSHGIDHLRGWVRALGH
jgi:hypothetical protein